MCMFHNMLDAVQGSYDHSIRSALNCQDKYWYTQLFHSSACPVAAQQKCPHPAAQGCPDNLLPVGKAIVPVPVPVAEAVSDATSVATDELSSSCSLEESKGLLLVTEWSRVSCGTEDGRTDTSTMGRSM